MDSNVRVVSVDNVGRCILAARDIQAGDTVLEDEAVMLAPGGGDRVCLECGVECEVSCPDCSLPLCCQGGKHEAECDPRLVFPSHTSRHLGVAILRLLRCMDTMDNREVVTGLMSHLAERRCDPDYHHMLTTVRSLEPVLGHSYSEDQLLELAGIILTNTVQCNMVPGGADTGIGLYPTFSLLSHSCVANTRREADDGKIRLIATVNIPEGEQVLTSYKNPLLGSVARRCHFPRIWYFDCECRRCCDPTELGSHLSSLRCDQCSHGLLLPAHPRAHNSPWSCAQCQHTLSSHQTMTKTISMYRTLLACPLNVDIISKLINHLETLAHPQHYVIIQVNSKYHSKTENSHFGNIFSGQVEDDQHS